MARPFSRLRSLLPKLGGPPVPRRRPPARLGLLALEDRVTPAIALVNDITGDAAGSDPRGFVVVNDVLYFAAAPAGTPANQIAARSQLHSYDPATGAVDRLSNFANASGFSSVVRLTAFAGKVVFTAVNDAAGQNVSAAGTSVVGNVGEELFQYDPATRLVSLVGDVNPGPGGSDPTELYAFAGKLYFTAANAGTNYEPWAYDGASPPALLREVNAGTVGSSPAHYTGFAGKLYFSASDASVPFNGFAHIQNSELWEFDPGTGQFQKFEIATSPAAAPLNYGSRPLDDRAVVNGVLYFGANRTSTDNDEVLYRLAAGGTPAFVGELNTTTSGFGPGADTYSDFTELGGKLYMRASDGNAAYGEELYVYDPAGNAFGLAADVAPGAAASSVPGQLTAVGGKLFFTADAAGQLGELWVYDPGAAAATRVTDINPAAGGDARVSGLTAVGGDLFFTASATGSASADLYRYSPASGQLTKATDAGQSASLSGSAAVGPNLYFQGATAATGRELYRFQVGASNQPPTAVTLSNSSVAENAAGATVGTVSAADPDGGDVAAMAYAVSDGRFEVTGTGTNRTLKLKAGQSLDHEAGPTVSLDITATDPGSLARTETFTISVTDVNEAPTFPAGGYAFSLGENSANTTAVGTVTASDVDAGQARTYAITAGNGTGGGAFAVHPTTGAITVADASQLNFETTQTFTLTVEATDTGSPQRSGTTTVTVTLRDVNERPAWVDLPASATAPELAAHTFGPRVSDPDTPAGFRNLTASIVGGGLAGMSALYNAAAGRVDFTWTPSEVQDGTHAVTLRIADDADPTLYTDAVYTLTVTEVNQAPVLAAVGNQNVNEGGPLSFTVSAADADAGPGAKNAVTYAAALENGDPLSAIGAAFDPATRQFTWTPTEAQDGTYRVTFTAADNGTPPLADGETVTITVGEVNQAPVLAPIGPKPAPEMTALAFTVSASDGDTGPGAQNSLTYSAAGLPTGASFDPATRQFTWTPGEDQDGIYDVVFGVSDGTAPAVTETVRITVGEVNRPPVLGAIGSRTGSEGTPITFTAASTDPDLPANGRTFALVGGPAGAAIDPATGAFSWTPPDSGEYTFTVRVTDAGSADPAAPALSDEEVITLSVANVAPAPAVTGGPTAGTVDSAPFAYTGSFADPAAANDSYLYTWQVKDSAGNIVRPGTPTATAHGVVPGYTFTEPASGRYAAGRYTVELVVNDQEANGIGTATRTVDVSAVLDGITRLDPAAASTNSGTLKFKVSFSDPVAGLTAGHFAVRTTGTFANPGTASVAPDTAGPNGSATWTVTVSGVSGDGDLYLTLLDTQGLTGPDAIAVAAVAGTGVDGERYGVDQTLARVVSFWAVSASGARYDLAAPGAAQSVPFAVKAFELELSEAATAPAALLSIAGLPAGVTLAYSGSGTDLLRWELSSAVQANNLALTLAASGPNTAVDNAGNVGLTGKTAYALRVLVGDATGDGRVTADDLRYVQAAIFAGGYDPRADVDGNGVVDQADYAEARRRLGQRL